MARFRQLRRHWSSQKENPAAGQNTQRRSPLSGLFLVASDSSHSFLHSLSGSLPTLAEATVEGVLVASGPNFHPADISITFIMPKSLQSEEDIMEGTSSPLILGHVHLKKLPNGYSSGLERM